MAKNNQRGNMAAIEWLVFVYKVVIRFQKNRFTASD
jgi:hypothetical protein